jgi:DNA-binding response OmpR family regulator
VKRLALIVEDDPALQRAMGLHLEQMHFEIAAAHHYEAAVDHLADRRPHLVCVGLELPTKSGYELCEYIRGPLGLKSVPILVTSHSSFAGEMASAEEAGANAFLKKPFTMLQLTKYIDVLLGATRPSTPYVRRLQRPL